MGDTQPKRARTTLAAFSVHAPPRILVAEDDNAMRGLVVQTLQRDGYAVQQVPDGGRLLVTLAQEYLNTEREQLVDLLIADVRMPICTGLQIVEQLRAARCPLPIILMTAFGDESTRRRARALGTLLLDKPFQMEELRAAVVRLLHSHL